jgi:ATP-dependent Lhr-like helicase
MTDAPDPLNGFHPATARWFRSALGEPTPPQALGWPPIRAGENTLVLAPTGSGKTLAAFLAGLDRLLREGLEGALRKGVSVLYISPLKALNYDIERNLRLPLEGIASEARAMGLEPPDIRTGVRTGDTPSRERAAMAKRPPHILITTPESLNLILCSRAHAMLAGVRQVIVDEIHSLLPNKRGAFLSVLLERLEDLTGGGFSRVGLSATVRDPEEAARFLGGYGSGGSPRPVRIVDVGAVRKLDLTVDTAVPDFRSVEPGDIWASLQRKLLREVERRRSTIIFANTRGAVERLSRELNELAGERLVEPHHGSISATRRRETEERLKRGELRAVVATGSLELGIDMGAVELVCQVGSPKSVASGLQRVGRAGHLAGAESAGRIFALSPVDLLECAALAAGMLRGEVEPARIVHNPLDVLAQQIAAMCVHGPVRAEDILRTVRRSACFHDLPTEAFRRTLEMTAGRMGHGLPARVALDRVNDRILPLPGTLRSVVAGGVIPDTGQFPVYLSGTRASIGELDEEFVFEAREGDAFRLGVSTWRIEKIEADRIFVHPAPGSPAKAPFWRGEQVSRPPSTGEAIGRLLAEAEMLETVEEISGFILRRTPCTDDAARNLAEFIFRQREKGALPTHRRVVAEFYRDAIGEGRMAVITPFGSRVHQALRIALTELLLEETGAAPESMAGDEGVLMRLPSEDCAPAALLRKLTPGRFRELLGRGLLRSPMFGLRFRQNAARALLMPPRQPGRRSPLWLQRLKAKDLLQIARRIPDFPVVEETIRECLEEQMDAGLTERILAGIQDGEVELREVSTATPSPFASALEFQLQMEFMYVWDRPVGAAGDAGAGEGTLRQLTAGRVPDPPRPGAAEGRDAAAHPSNAGKDGRRAGGDAAPAGRPDGGGGRSPVRGRRTHAASRAGLRRDGGYRGSRRRGALRSGRGSPGVAGGSARPGRQPGLLEPGGRPLHPGEPRVPSRRVRLPLRSGAGPGAAVLRGRARLRRRAGGGGPLADRRCAGGRAQDLPRAETQGGRGRSLWSGSSSSSWSGSTPRRGPACRARKGSSRHWSSLPDAAFPPGCGNRRSWRAGSRDTTRSGWTGCWEPGSSSGGASRGRAVRAIWLCFPEVWNACRSSGGSRRLRRTHPSKRWCCAPCGNAAQAFWWTWG